MIKLIPATEVTSCYGCPHMRYDPNYGRSYDSGYDCKRTGKRIADDYEIKQYDSAIEEYEESLLTLLPLPKPTTKDPMAFPSWCPLEDKI